MNDRLTSSVLKQSSSLTCFINSFEMHSSVCTLQCSSWRMLVVPFFSDGRGPSPNLSCLPRLLPWPSVSAWLWSPHTLPVQAVKTAAPVRPQPPSPYSTSISPGRRSAGSRQPLLCLLWCSSWKWDFLGRI